MLRFPAILIEYLQLTFQREEDMPLPAEISCTFDAHDPVIHHVPLGSMVLHVVDLALVQFQSCDETDIVLLKKVGILLGMGAIIEHSLLTENI